MRYLFACLLASMGPVVGCGSSQGAESAAAPSNALQGSYAPWWGDGGVYAGNLYAPVCHWQDLHTTNPFLLCAYYGPSNVPSAFCSGVPDYRLEFTLSPDFSVSGIGGATRWQESGSVITLDTGMTLEITPLDGTSDFIVKYDSTCMVRYRRTL